MYHILVLAGLIALGTTLLPRVVLWHRLLYGTILPELVVFGSHKDRRRAFRGTWKSVRGDSWVTLLFSVMLVGLWMLLGRGPWLGSASFMLFITVFFLAPDVVAITLFFGLFRNRLRRSLRRQLAEGGHAICVPCAYDLRGQTEPRCPECGRAVIRVVEPRQESSL